jgi:hypothetical protein
VPRAPGENDGVRTLLGVGFEIERVFEIERQFGAIAAKAVPVRSSQ